MVEMVGEKKTVFLPRSGEIFLHFALYIIDFHAQMDIFCCILPNGKW